MKLFPKVLFIPGSGQCSRDFLQTIINMIVTHHYIGINPKADCIIVQRIGNIIINAESILKYSKRSNKKNANPSRQCYIGVWKLKNNSMRTKIKHMEKENIKILEKAIEKWGAASQLEMIVEECLELALAIQKFRRHQHDPDPIDKYNAIIDEIADVKIMMAQAEILFPKKLIDQRIVFKMNRLKERLQDDANI